MAVKTKKLTKISSGKVCLFKIKNRRGYAGVCLNHLTEGSSPAQVMERLQKAVKRAGYEISGGVPKAR